MRILSILAVLFCFFSNPRIAAQHENIPIMGFSEFEKYLHKDTDTVYIVNFWATWCGPCRRELPEFEKIHKAYASEKVKVLLVSLDFPSMLEKGLYPFLKSNQVTAGVILLNEPDANAWIDKVDPSWTGSLPATLLYRGKERQFYEKELTYQEIDHSIHSLILKSVQL
jgi:thiol-disulfide isomerase/thioredoxin